MSQNEPIDVDGYSSIDELPSSDSLHDFIDSDDDLGQIIYEDDSSSDPISPQQTPKKRRLYRALRHVTPPHSPRSGAPYLPRVPDPPPTVNEPSDEPRINSRSDHWVFTLNNYTPQDYYRLLGMDFNKNKVNFFVVQPEVGQNGIKHLQGAICFDIRKQFSTVKRPTRS